MKNILVVFMLSFVSLVYGCRGSESKTAPRPNPKVVDSNLCESAGKNLETRGCIPDATHFTKRGLSFKEFCENTQNEQIWLNPKCLSEIQPKDMAECRDMIDVCTYSK